MSLEDDISREILKELASQISNMMSTSELEDDPPTFIPSVDRLLGDNAQVDTVTPPMDEDLL